MKILFIILFFPISIFAEDFWEPYKIGWDGGHQAWLNDLVQFNANDSLYIFVCNYGLYRNYGKYFGNIKNWKDVTNIITNDSIVNCYGKYTFLRFGHTNKAVLASIKGGSLVVSFDWGSSWHFVEANGIGEIKVFYVDGNDVILAGTTNGLFQSTDDGYNWTRANTGLQLDNTVINEIKKDESGNLFACSKGALIRRDAQTKEWSLINLDSILTSNINDIAFFYDYIFLATDSGIIASADKGNKWRKTHNELSDKKVTALVIAYGKVYAGTEYDGLYFSRDSGNNWIYNSFLENQAVKRMFEDRRFIAYGTSIYGCGNGYFVDSNFDPTMEEGIIFGFGYSQGYPEVQNVFFNSESRMFYMADGNIYRFGQEVYFYRMTVLLPRKKEMLYYGCDKADNVYYSGLGLPLYRIAGKDMWKTEEWEETVYFSAPDSSVVSVTNMAVTEEGAIFAINIEGKLFSSRDDGSTWKKEDSFDSTFHISYNKNKQLLAASKEKFSISDNDGYNWSTYKNNFSTQFNDTVNVYNLLNYIITAGGKCGIYYSDDYGERWTRANGAPCIEYNAFLNAGNELYASCDSGVYRSLDNGKTWLEYNDGMPRLKNCKMMAVDKEGYVYVATKYYGLYRSKSPANSVRESNAFISTKLHLETLPNPIFSEAEITYTTHTTGRTKLVLYNLLGMPVAMLADAHHEAGRHTARLTTAELAAGAYFLRLESGGEGVTMAVWVVK